MKTLGEILKLAGAYLEEKGIGRARRVAEDLLAHILHKKRLDLYLDFDKPLEEKELALFRAYLLRRAKGEPLEYILGEIEFYGCRLQITSDVLIPRPETELLLDKVCQRLHKDDLKGKIAWDVCTGSGCLGLGLKKKFPELEVALSDLSKKALEVAKINSLQNNLEVECVEGDLLAPFEGKKADIILANPPYISPNEFLALDPEVREFEPKMALLAQEEGLEFYRRLSNDLPNYLNRKAKIFFEIGYDQGQKILTLFSAPYWTIKFFEPDLSLHDRFFFLEFE